jgi:hypothetical protein
MALEKILLGDATSTAVTKVNNAITQANTSADDIEEIKETLNVLENRDPMSYRGTLGTGGTITALPSTGVLNGDTYKVITAGTYNQMYAGVGDLFIAKVDNSTVTWTLVPSGDDGDVFADENFNAVDEIIVASSAGSKKVKGSQYSISSEDIRTFDKNVVEEKKIPTREAVYNALSGIGLHTLWLFWLTQTTENDYVIFTKTFGEEETIYKHLYRASPIAFVDIQNGYLPLIADYSLTRDYIKKTITVTIKVAKSKVEADEDYAYHCALLFVSWSLDMSQTIG